MIIGVDDLEKNSVLVKDQEKYLKRLKKGFSKPYIINKDKPIIKVKVSGENIIRDEKDTIFKV